MRKVQVTVELPDDHYRSFAAEARRRGVSVESLVERMVHELVAELERDENEGTDHLIIPS